MTTNTTDATNGEAGDPVAAGVAKIEDLLTMLGVNPDEVQEHGGPTTAETLVQAVIDAAAPLIVAAELEKLADGSDRTARAVRNFGFTDYSEGKADGMKSAAATLRERAKQLRGEA